MRSLLVLLAIATPAAAQPGDIVDPAGSQVQLDLGLSVITVNYELPVAQRVSLSVGAGVFSTWFAPVFGVGDAFIGPGGEVRVTRWFSDDNHGLYVTPFVRVSRATGEDEDMTVEGTAFGFTAGAIVGWALPLTSRLDLRLGVGPKYIRFVADDVSVSTPFVTIDAVLGYRL